MDASSARHVTLRPFLVGAHIENHQVTHADHISSACRLRSLTGCKVAYPAMDGLPCADVGVAED